MSLDEVRFKDELPRVLGALLDYVDDKDVAFVPYEPGINPVASVVARTLAHGLQDVRAPFEARYSGTLADHRKGTKLVLVVALVNNEDFDEVNLERLPEGVVKYAHDGQDDFRVLFINCHYARVPTVVGQFKAVARTYLQERYASNRAEDSATRPTL